MHLHLPQPFTTHHTPACAPPQACHHWLDVPRFSADGQEVVATYHIDGCMVGLRHVHAALVFTIDVEGRHLWRVPLLPAAPGPLAVDYASQGHVVVCTQHDGHVYLVQHRYAAGFMYCYILFCCCCSFLCCCSSFLRGIVCT
jgi:hypothetical protein